MNRIHVTSERVIDAIPEDVYAAVSDYKAQRPNILTPNFLDYKVEQGGRGDGTVVSYRLRAANRERAYRMRVKEPVKGEVLTESDAGSSLVTMWTLLPTNNGQSTKVRVTSEWEGSRGVSGFFERTFAPLGLRRIYANMLTSLEEVVSSNERATETEQSNLFPGLAVALLLAAAAVAAVLVVRNMQKNN